MRRGCIGFAAALLAVAAAVLPMAGPAQATHDDDTLWVTVDVNAAGPDRIGVSEDTYGAIDYLVLVADVAVALGQPVGTFRASEVIDGASARLDGKLAEPGEDGRFSYELDTGQLQVLALRRDYESVAVEVCTPRVRQIVDVLVAPQSFPAITSPGRRCRGWFQLVDEAPIRAEIELSPDRDRYPSAMSRTVGAAATAFALLGLGATLLRRGPMKRRSVGSWLLAVGSFLGMALLGWALVTFTLWWTGATADPILLGGSSAGEQNARLLLPGLVFLVPALLPAALLLTVPRREKPPPPSPPAAPPVPTWWPTAWWSQWAAQNGSPATPAPAPAPAPASVPPGPPPSGGPRGWAAPGSGHG